MVSIEPQQFAGTIQLTTYPKDQPGRPPRRRRLPNLRKRPRGRPGRAADRGEVEKMTEQHNVRIRPSVKARAVRAVGKLRYETGNKDVSLQSITDAALDEYLRKHGC